MGLWDKAAGWLSGGNPAYKVQKALKYYNQFGKPLIHTVRNVGVRNTAILAGRAAGPYALVAAPVVTSVLLASELGRQHREMVARNLRKSSGRADSILAQSRRYDDFLSASSRRAEIQRGDYRRILDNSNVRDAYRTTTRVLTPNSLTSRSSYIYRDPTTRIDWSKPQIKSAYATTVSALNRMNRWRN